MTLSFFSSSSFRLALRRPCHQVTTSHQHQPSPDKTGQFLSDWLCQIQGYTPNATNVALIAYRAERGGGIARADMKGVTGAACETKNKDGSSAYITLTSCPPCPLCLFTPSVLHRSLSLSVWFCTSRQSKQSRRAFIRLPKVPPLAGVSVRHQCSRRCSPDTKRKRSRSRRRRHPRRTSPLMHPDFFSLVFFARRPSETPPPLLQMEVCRPGRRS